MIFNKIGGGSEKVTLDGKTVTKRYNFITSEKIKKDLQAMPYSCGGVAMIACSDHKRNTFHAFGHISGPALFHCSWDANSRKWTQHGEEKGFWTMHILQDLHIGKKILIFYLVLHIMVKELIESGTEVVGHLYLLLQLMYMTLL